MTRKIKLIPSKEKEGILVGTKSDGRKYSVRNSRFRYFFPQEWKDFIKQITNKEHRFFFLTLLHTGARVMEALHLKHEDIDTTRGTVKFTIVKQRKARHDYSVGKERSFFVSSKYISEYKAFIRGKTIDKSKYIFLNNEKLPENYDTLINSDKLKFYNSKKTSYSLIMKRKLELAKISDYYNFSLHNIRKTYGMWMRIFELDMSEICYRMGHDIDTFMSHYGSSLIFTVSERREILNLFGDVK